MTKLELEILLDSLIALPRETEWAEFKENNDDPEYIGRCCSALSNSARLADQKAGYLVYGVRDQSHEKVGTSVDLAAKKVGNEPFLNWLTRTLSPDISPSFHELSVGPKRFQIVRVLPAQGEPTAFRGEPYIRVGSTTHKLREYSQRAAELWQRCSGYDYEIASAFENATVSDIERLLDVPAIFVLFNRSAPPDSDRLLEFLVGRGIITKEITGRLSITNVGALLFARDLSAFAHLSRKAPRLIRYEGRNKLTALSEKVQNFGYAVGFDDLMRQTLAIVPGREIIDSGLRRVMRIIPDVALREIVVNALFHQDLSVRGSGPLIEVYDDRVEVSNPGSPLIDVERLMDTQPRSRNEKMGVLLREIGLCEERGSGIDRTIASLEERGLPAPLFVSEPNGLRVSMQAAKSLADMTQDERLMSCYWHSCLRHLHNQQMSNSSLRIRLGVKQSNYPQVSKLIADALAEELIKPYDPQNRSKKHAKYVPFWA